MATTITRQPFGPRLREARIEAGLTQTQLGAKVDHTYQAVQHWESTQRTVFPKPTDWATLEDALGLEPGTIYRWVMEDPKAGDHPPATSGKRCSLSVAAGLRNHLHVTLHHAADALA